MGPVGPRSRHSSLFHSCFPENAHRAWQVILHPLPGCSPQPFPYGEHLDRCGGGTCTYLRSVKRTVSSLWEATITLALALCFSSSRT